MPTVSKNLPVPRIRSEVSNEAHRAPELDKPCPDCEDAKRNVDALAYKANMGGASYVIWHCSYHQHEIGSQRL